MRQFSMCLRNCIDDANISTEKTHMDFNIFYILGPVKRILELQYHFFWNSRWQGPPYSVVCEYEVALKNSGISVA